MYFQLPLPPMYFQLPLPQKKEIKNLHQKYTTVTDREITVSTIMMFQKDFIMFFDDFRVIMMFSSTYSAH